MEEKIIRPTTKPEAIKGKLLKYQGTDYCEFMPQAQGEPQYEGISKTRHSQLKRSKGKAPKLVAHLTAQAESAPAVEASTLDLKGLAPATAQPFKGKKEKVVDELNHLAFVGRDEAPTCIETEIYHFCYTFT